MSASNGFTPIQCKILAVLSDGKYHHKRELQVCRGPSSLSGLRVTLAHLRAKLRARGEDIVSVNTGKEGSRYMHVRLLNVEE